MNAVTGEPTIHLQGVRMVYPAPRGLFEALRRPLSGSSGTEALRDIDMRVGRGEVFGLLGPNGAGKTTLTRILCNLIIPTSGSMRIDGHVLDGNSAAIRSCVGLVSGDERSFFWRLSGLENLHFFAALHRVPPAEARARIDRFLALFQLTAVARRRFGLYSSGQKKLFSIIRALVPSPSVLVLDEPTNALDPTMAAGLLEYVRGELAVKERRTIVWATHRLEEARDICDAVMVLHEGRNRFTGKFADFAALGDDPRRGQGPLVDAFKKLVES